MLEVIMDKGENLMEGFLDNMARAIDQMTQDVFHTRLGFVLLMFPFGETDKTNLHKKEGEEGGNYVSNADRGDIVRFLRETADRLEQKQEIGRTIGRA